MQAVSGCGCVSGYVSGYVMRTAQPWASNAWMLLATERIPLLFNGVLYIITDKKQQITYVLQLHVAGSSILWQKFCPQYALLCFVRPDIERISPLFWWAGRYKARFLSFFMNSHFQLLISFADRIIFKFIFIVSSWMRRHSRASCRIRRLRTSPSASCL